MLLNANYSGFSILPNYKYISRIIISMCFRTSNLRYIDNKDEENNIVIQNNFNAVINGDYKVRNIKNRQYNETYRKISN